MKKISTCPICEEGILEARIGTNEVEYKGKGKTIPMHYSECACCGSEQASSSDLRKNKRLMIEFKKEVDGLLTGKELKEIRIELVLTQADAAKIFGGGPVAFSKYEADDVAQAESMDKLLRLAHAVPEAYAHLTHNSGYTKEVEQEISSEQWNWKQFIPELNATTKPKPRPVLKVIKSKDFGHNAGYGDLQAVG
ncbi:type II toxin-antitoxin system MqsA family antitoxin [Paraglaciecola sp.]|uniref:type II toxin-antitoxin system MqsA family antitoxin n=1 Tax=Paraglaciecola sp. TaxID=1920173 RepID=UPI0032653E9D